MFIKLAMLPAVILAVLWSVASHFDDPRQTAATIVVETRYPGANATEVANNVAAPIEEQVNGVENMLHLESRSSNDGRYILAVTFKPGADLDKAMTLVQNRVELVLPILPDVVKNEGLSIRKKGPVRMIVSLTSPGGRFDAPFLSDYGTAQVQDELARVSGVGVITGIGQGATNIRVWLDPGKLAAFQMSAADVASALDRQVGKVAGATPPPPIATQGFQLTIPMRGRLADPKDLADTILKTDSKGGPVRLKDVGQVESGRDTGGYAGLNGKPGMVLAIHPIVSVSLKDMSRAIADRIAGLRAQAPEGVHLAVAFDFTANVEAPRGPKAAEYLLLDLQLAEGAPGERRRETLARYAKLVHDVAGVQDVLALSDNPFDILGNQPCVLARLAPADKRNINREQIVANIRKKFEQVPEAALRLRDLSRPGSFQRGGYSIDLAVSGPEINRVRDLAQELAERLRKSKKLTDVWMNQDSTPRPVLTVEIDRVKAEGLGLAPEEIVGTLRAFLGSAYINDFERSSRTWQVAVQTDDKFRKRVEDLRQVKVRNKQGRMVALAEITTLSKGNAPAAIHRLDLRPMVEVTANPSAELSLMQARTLCETLLEECRKEAGLPSEYRLTWLGDRSTPDE